MGKTGRWGLKQISFGGNRKWKACSRRSLCPSFYVPGPVSWLETQEHRFFLFSTQSHPHQCTSLSLGEW